MNVDRKLVAFVAGVIVIAFSIGILPAIGIGLVAWSVK